MENLGEVISKPFMCLVPIKTNPNTITFINSAVNIAQFILCFSFAATPITLFTCGMLTLASTVLDCLDGMQARRSDQCSVFGHALDHWVDAGHIPMLVIGICHCAEFPRIATALVLSCASSVYHSQLLVEHRTHVDPGAEGVAVQLLIAVLFFILSMGFLPGLLEIKMATVSILIWTVDRVIRFQLSVDDLIETAGFSIVMALAFYTPIHLEHAAVMTINMCLDMNGGLVLASATNRKHDSVLIENATKLGVFLMLQRSYALATFQLILEGISRFFAVVNLGYFLYYK